MKKSNKMLFQYMANIKKHLKDKLIKPPFLISLFFPVHDRGMKLYTNIQCSYNYFEKFGS